MKMERKIGKICISSVFSREAGFVDYRFTACKAAEELGYEVYRNPENVGATQESFEAYLKEKSPIFLLLIGDVKSNTVAEECRLALSLGLHIITLLHTTGTNISEETKKIMKSISKATYDKNCSCFQNCEELYEAVQSRLITYEENHQEQKVNFVPQHAEVYTKSTEIMASAKKRIIICQKTSSLILGPRKGIEFEKNFYDSLIRRIKRYEKNFEILHIFHYTATRSAIKEKDYDIMKAKTNLENILAKRKVNLIIRYFEQELTPCVICDNSLLVSLPLGKQEYNLFLPNHVMSGTTVSKIITDIQGTGKVLFSKKFLQHEFEDIYKI